MAEIEKKPFPESVVDFINQVECPTTLRNIALLLSTTEVLNPENQEAIANALLQKNEELSSRDYDFLAEVANLLLYPDHQKRKISE